MQQRHWPLSRVPRSRCRTGAPLRAPSFLHRGASWAPAALQQARQQQAWIQSPDAQLLVNWVENAGGFLHPALRVVENAPCGCRGVVAQQPIPLDEVDGGQPLVVVPEELYMTHDDALEVLGRALTQAATAGQQQQQQQQQLEAVDPAVLLGVLLAHERIKDGSSRWAPYIQVLPQRPPCAWLMTEQELRAALAALPKSFDARGWDVAAAGARKAIFSQARSLVDAWGSTWGVSGEDVAWGVGHVVSRSFGGGVPGGPALAPLIDCMNHESGRAKPAAFDAADFDAEGEQQRHGSADQTPQVMAYVASTLQGEPSPLEAGQELMISYISTQGPGQRQSAPLMAFLNFGFVPQELLA